MARSSWKFNYINTHIYTNVFLNKFKSIKLTKLFCRSSVIPRNFFKKTISLYKGNMFVRIMFNRYTLGSKLGEFAITRKPFNFPLKKKKNKR